MLKRGHLSVADHRILLAAGVPVLVAILGAATTSCRRPSEQTRSVIKHLAAGIVFAAGAVEVLPDVLRAGSAAAISIGGGLGVLAMVGLQMIERRYQGPTGLITVAGIDVLFDGFVLGLAFGQGQKQGVLLTGAVSAELLFLGLALSDSLVTRGRAPCLSERSLSRQQW
jgi:ZIP family zinc transporter